MVVLIRRVEWILCFRRCRAPEYTADSTPTLLLSIQLRLLKMELGDFSSGELIINLYLPAVDNNRRIIKPPDGAEATALLFCPTTMLLSCENR